MYVIRLKCVTVASKNSADTVKGKHSLRTAVANTVT